MAVITPADWNSKAAITPIGPGHVFRTVELTSGQVANGNFVKLAILPAGYRIVDLKVETDDLDSHGTPTVTGSVGILNSGETDLTSGQIAITDSQIFRTGGIANIGTACLEAIGSSTSDRTIALKFTAAVATAAAGGVSISMLIAPA